MLNQKKISSPEFSTLDNEQWKYANIKQYKTFNFNFKYSNQNNKKKCTNSDILLKNGELISHRTDENKIQIMDIHQALKKNCFNLNKTLKKFSS